MHIIVPLFIDYVKFLTSDSFPLFVFDVVQLSCLFGSKLFYHHVGAIYNLSYNFDLNLSIIFPFVWLWLYRLNFKPMDHMLVL